MQAPLLKILLTAALSSSACAVASPVFLNDQVAVDRSGNSLVSMARESGTAAIAVLDARGQVSYCRVGFQGKARARTDADGFLVLRDYAFLTQSLERWDGQGRVDWEFVTPGSDFAPMADGGAVLWEEELEAPGVLRAELVRLFPDGNLRWRAPVYSAPSAALSVDLVGDSQGRVRFATAPLANVLTGEFYGIARLGMVGADGQLAWSYSEPRATASDSRLLDAGDGDMWWYLSLSRLSARLITYFPSQLSHWTPWGLPLATFDGRALVAGTEILQPASDHQGSVWYLAGQEAGIRELARIGNVGREARHPIALNDPIVLDANAGSAWLTGSTTSGQLAVQRYTHAGPAWSRVLPDRNRNLRLIVTPSGDARIASQDQEGAPWLSRLTPQHGEVAWRVSLTNVYEACLAE
jgi:hypothetical protein